MAFGLCRQTDRQTVTTVLIPVISPKMKGSPNGFSGCSVPAVPGTFLTNCGRGENLGTTTCLNNMVGGKQGLVACEILSL